MNAIFYPAIFHPEETGYSVEIPDIEGLSLIHISEPTRP